VKIYLFRLFHKLGVRNRFELARCGILDQFQLSPSAGARTNGQGIPSLMETLATTAPATGAS
jgi:hypothetical protein